MSDSGTVVDAGEISVVSSLCSFHNGDCSPSDLLSKYHEKVCKGSDDSVEFLVLGWLTYL